MGVNDVLLYDCGIFMNKLCGPNCKSQVFFKATASNGKWFVIHCCLVLDFIVTFEAVLLFCPKTFERCWPAQDDPVVDVTPCLGCFLFSG